MKCYVMHSHIKLVTVSNVIDNRLNTWAYFFIVYRHVCLYVYINELLAK